MLYNLQLISLYLVYHIYANLWNIIISFIVKHVCFFFFTVLIVQEILKPLSTSQIDR